MMRVGFPLLLLMVATHAFSPSYRCIPPIRINQKLASTQRGSSKTIALAATDSTTSSFMDENDANEENEQIIISSTGTTNATGDMQHALSDFTQAAIPVSSWKRFVQALPNIRSGGDTLDRTILETAIPSMINLAVVPIVNSVDTFWVGRMGNALALAGQSAANQVFFTLLFLVAFLPTITAPLVATAVASGDKETARQRICESLFLCNVLGGLGTILLVGFPRVGLSLVLPANAPAMEYAAPYMRLRAISMIPSLISATGFAAYRGMLNTVTPLKVSLVTNAMNLVLDPLTMYGSRGIGYVGAALATAISETTGGMIYLRLLLRRKLVKLSLLVKPPSWENLKPLIRGGAAILIRQAALNAGYVTATRRAQAMDPTGVTGAAYGIVMQMYSLGIVIHVAIQGTAAALIPAALAKSGEDEARSVADRLFVWGSIVGLSLGLAQYFATPFLVPVFSTLPAVQEAVKRPALIAALMHVINGPVFAGEGAMLGLSRFKALASVTAMGIGIMVVCLSTPMGQRLDGILMSLAVFCGFQMIGVIVDHLKFSPLSRRLKKKAVAKEA